MTRATWTVLFLGLGLLAGCSHGGGGTAPSVEYTELQDVNDLLHAGAGASNRVPSKLSDLERFQGQFGRGYNAIKSGDVVVLWGSPLKGEGDVGKDEVVVAYEKNVPTSGGFVLLSAGSLKKMSPEEFNAATKGAKK